MNKLIPYAGKDIKNGVTKTARVDFRITPEQKSTLERVAKKRYRSVTSLLNEWIDWIEREDTK